MPKRVHHGDQCPGFGGLDQVEIPGLGLAIERPRGNAPFEQTRRGRGSQGLRFHFFMVTVVPRPTSETMLKSSMIRFAPGSPSPRLLPVE